MIHTKPLYVPKSTAMHVVVFASGSGGNLKAAIDLSIQYPSLVKVGLLVTDRLGIGAIDIAKKYNIPVIAKDFEKECGVWSACKNDPKKISEYNRKSINFHNNLLKEILLIEKKYLYPFDFAVLSYHRWVRGALLKYFEERMINQHAGDLTVFSNDDSSARRYIGINPVLYALNAGEKRTRTSTFLVRAGNDNGEILCQGPWVIYRGKFPITKHSAREHELVQKRISDWPSLKFALFHISKGNFGITRISFNDGCKKLVFKNELLSYGGVDLA